MSADNWTRCPRCEERRQAHLAELEQDIADSYGKVSVDDFDAKRAAYADESTKRVEPTWREDYELGLVDDEFYVSYRGRCVTCGLEHKFNIEEPLTWGGAK